MNQQLLVLAANTATAHGLDVKLVCAVVEQESGWDTWAIRYERNFDKVYVANHGFGDTEEIARSISWGLMQLMGECARERGFTGDLSRLCDPVIGLNWGCKHLAAKLAAHGNDVHAGLQAWNGGGNPNYAGEVMARIPTYEIAAPAAESEVRGV